MLLLDEYVAIIQMQARSPVDGIKLWNSRAQKYDSCILPTRQHILIFL
jgi:hypothetical protein